MIELLRSYEDTTTLGLMFLWQGMNISLDLTKQSDERKYLLVTVENAGAAGFTLVGNTVRWIIYTADGQKSDAIVSTICAGAAHDAT